MLATQVTKENLHKMIVKFYAQVIKDELVGSFFIEKLGNDLKGEKWLVHLETLTDFWAAVPLQDFSYKGNPFAPHLQIEGISAEAFQRWLELFSQTLDAIYVEEIANSFKNRSQVIAGNFMRNLGLSNQYIRMSQ